MFKRFFLATLVVAALLGGLNTQPLVAQDALVYDYEWLEETVTRPDALNVLALAWMNRTGDHWRNEGLAGVHDIVAHSVVIGSSMTAGNDPAFHPLSPNVWYTPEGGRFGTEEGYRAFQLDGAPVAPASRPASIDAMIALIRTESEYGRKIAALDIEWTGGEDVINRWGSSGPLELLSDAQEAALEAAGLELQPLTQQLPGNSIVWGELAPGDAHYGLVMIDQNIYATTCLGGMFVTHRGFRAMQFEEAAPGAVISDTTGCNGLYPLLDPNNIRSVVPLSTPTTNN